MTRRAAERFRRLPPLERRFCHALGLCAAVYCVHYTLLSFWFIEDAAISFAFARNFAEGEGFVAYPGGERVEGFSNPTWTLLLAGLHAVGINPWIGAKLLGLLLGLATLPLALAWARRALGDGAGLFPAVAPLALAVSPQFVIWNASGLENALFAALLAAGSVQILRESEEDGAPISALAWSLLAFTRPEAPLYAAVGGALGGAGVLAGRGPRAALGWAWRWGLLFLAPFLAWHGWRYAYFAFELPNTYYAKLGDLDRFQPFSWTTKGWKYLRDFALQSGQGFLAPLYAFAMTGARGGRGVIALCFVLALVVLTAPSLEWPRFLPFWPTGAEPAWWVELRVLALLAAGALLPLVGLGRPGVVARTLAWSLAGVALFFALYSGGDWMAGWRWISMAVVPLAVLFAAGVRAVAEGVRLPRATDRAPRALAGLLVGAAVVLGAVNTGIFLSNPETSPYDVGRRVTYMRGVQDRLALDHVTLLEVDMGAHMWWSGFDVVDLAGLVDVPMGHHKWEMPFVERYVYEERRPEFAHVHGGWSSRTKMTRHDAWKGYLELPGYPISPWTLHPGNHIRRDLLVTRSWARKPGRAAVFSRAGRAGVDLRLVGFDVVAPEVAPGGTLFLELALERPGPPKDYRVIAFLAGEGRVVSHELPPGYDWYPSGQWKRGEFVLGRHHLPLPADLPPGSYDLGFLVLSEGEAGEVLSASAPAQAPALARGEARFAKVVTVLPRAELERVAGADRDAAVAAATEGACEGAEAAWERARRHFAPSDGWVATEAPAASSALAACLARRAATERDRVSGAELVARARRWDRHDPAVRAAGEVVADALEAEGDGLAARGDDAGAYAAWRDALRADPSRSWVRRRAEEARDRALGLDPDAALAEAREDGGAGPD